MSHNADFHQRDRLHDHVALDEIALYAEVLIAVADADRPLSPAELDRALGVSAGPEAVEAVEATGAVRGRGPGPTRPPGPTGPTGPPPRVPGQGPTPAPTDPRDDETAARALPRTASPAPAPGFRLLSEIVRFTGTPLPPTPTVACRRPGPALPLWASRPIDR